MDKIVHPSRYSFQPEWSGKINNSDDDGANLVNFYQSLTITSIMKMLDSYNKMLRRKK